MAAKLNTTVHVHKDGESHVFGPGDSLPDWAVKAISNPNVWDEPPASAKSDSK